MKSQKSTKDNKDTKSQKSTKEADAAAAAAEKERLDKEAAEKASAYAKSTKDHTEERLDTTVQLPDDDYANGRGTPSSTGSPQKRSKAYKTPKRQETDPGLSRDKS